MFKYFILQQRYIPLYTGSFILIIYLLGLSKYNHSIMIHIQVFLTFLYLAHYGIETV